MTEVSIILPTYNEADNILQMIQSVNGAVGGYDAEILVVDDDSPDGTSDVVREVLNHFSKLRLITRTSNKGLVRAIQEGVKESQGDICVWMDADLSMPATTIPKLIDEIYRGADLALGSRYIKGGGIKGSCPNGNKIGPIQIWRNLKETEDTFLAVAISKIGNVFAQTILDSRYHDYTSGFYAVRKQVIDDVGLEGAYLDYCISLLYKTIRRGYNVSEVPVVIVPRLKGESKTSNNVLSIISVTFDCVVRVFWLRLTEKQRKF